MHTHRLDKDSDLLKLTGSAFGTQADANMKGYLRLPINVPDGVLPNTSWLLLLELTGKNHGLLPFEIAGDVVLGRGADGDDAPDLDLTALNAYEMGVSRRHAMFRPTTNHLYLIDMGSTNGCTVNGLSTGKGAVPLRRHDHITLGQLNMRILTLERVLGTVDAAKLEQAPPAPTPAVIVLPPAAELPPTTPTPPLEKRNLILQKPDVTLPLPQNVEVTAEVKKPVDDPKPEDSIKPADDPKSVESIKPAEPEKPQAEAEKIKTENMTSEADKPPSTL
jgi:hypothetical protein